MRHQGQDRGAREKHARVCCTRGGYAVCTGGEATVRHYSSLKDGKGRDDGKAAIWRSILTGRAALRLEKMK